MCMLIKELIQSAARGQTFGISSFSSYSSYLGRWNGVSTDIFGPQVLLPVSRAGPLPLHLMITKRVGGSRCAANERVRYNWPPAADLRPDLTLFCRRRDQ